MTEISYAGYILVLEWQLIIRVIPPEIDHADVKTLLRLIAIFFLCETTSEAGILYQNDFSVAPIAGWFQGDWNDFNNFIHTWSLTSSLQSDSGNKYARYDFNIPSLPVDPNTIWSGGFEDSVGSFTVLPAQWQLSFDIFLNNLEPIEVSFSFFPNSSFHPIVFNYWVEPANVGWQPIVINQNTTTSTGFGGEVFSPNRETLLTIGLASQGQYGNPLSISQIGTYDFLLDNVVLESVPEPPGVGLISIAGTVFVGIRRYKRACWK